VQHPGYYIEQTFSCQEQAARGRAAEDNRADRDQGRYNDCGIDRAHSGAEGQSPGWDSQTGVMRGCRGQEEP
jgi:hypothetical protein